ncbi:MAG: Tol-Pal system beta propeller repeat protein TolB [Sulfuricella sp.]|nr:Tol-Pal system beta propeller repeat protein TolB [Sulfuricella sp.]
MKFLNKLAAALILLAGFPISAAHAALTIEIVGSGANQIPIAVVPFAGESVLPQGITAVIAADLQRSGLFKIVDPAGVKPEPHEPAEVNYPDWRARGADALAIGSVLARPDGKLEVRFRLLDAVKQVQLDAYSYVIDRAQTRATAHKIADLIYEKLTGDVGVFSTRIAYIVKSGTRYELQVADADGYGAQTVLASSEPIISPAWSPDGTKLAYVSFERKKPIIYVQSLVSGQRQVLAQFKGNNSSPSWSPDGKQLAIVLTKDGSSQIYLINADGSGVKRLGYSSGIDTEPSFSPDGTSIIFTSDRGGSPQIYRMSVSGSGAQRLTFEGNYNVSPHFSPDGKSFTFIQRVSGSSFHVALQDLASGQMQLLTDTRMDESPSFAPNGKMLLYATEIGGRGVLAAVSSDGRVKQRLSTQTGDVREPEWGPLLIK